MMVAHTFSFGSRRNRPPIFDRENMKKEEAAGALDNTIVSVNLKVGHL